MVKANFEWSLVKLDPLGIYLKIIDLYSPSNPTMSVTNDIENVLIYIKEQEGFLPDHIMYMDTDGVWDGVTVNELNELISFIPLSVKDEKIAVKLLFKKI